MTLRAFRTALRLSSAERRVLLEALVWLAAARLAIVLLPFRILARRLGDHMKESATLDDASQLAVLRRTSWAIGAVSRRAPWRCKCLEQGIAAKMMLRRHGIPNTLYLGVAREPGEAEVKAHAWVRCGTLYVTGGADRDRFAVVSTFADGTKP